MEAAVKKLEAEKEKYAGDVRCEYIINFLIERAKEDSGMADDVKQESKNFEKCWDYITARAVEFSKSAKNKMKRGNSTMVENETVLEWAEDYYHATDAAVNKTMKSKAGVAVTSTASGLPKPKTENKAVAKSDTSQKSKAENKKADKVTEQKAPAEKKKPKAGGMEGQMSLFDMFQ